MENADAGERPQDSVQGLLVKVRADASSFVVFGPDSSLSAIPNFAAAAIAAPFQWAKTISITVTKFATEGAGCIAAEYTPAWEEAEMPSIRKNAILASHIE